MPLMSTCLGRLGSRYSMILDPNRREVDYGALGLYCQQKVGMVVGLDDGQGHFSGLPLAKDVQVFDMIDQHQTMTSLVYEAYDERHGVKLVVEIVSPFWPQDVATSVIPAYILNFHISPVKRIRARVLSSSAKGKAGEAENYWAYSAARPVERKGTLRFGLDLSEGTFRKRGEALSATIPVKISSTGKVQGDGNPFRTGRPRTAPLEGLSTDMLFGLAGDWRIKKGYLEVDFDLDAHCEQRFSAAMVSYCGASLFERLGESMPLKYTTLWKGALEVADYVRGHYEELLKKSRSFDAIWQDISLPMSVHDVTSLSFQTYLMNTFWASHEGTQVGADWFSVWEGNCLMHSTVDVEYNNALFYFACWPELLELIFAEWAQHGNTAEVERARRESLPEGSFHKKVRPEELEYPGMILEHDMGKGWSANGQAYQHAMPVEENANFLLMLYGHGKWWGRERLFKQYNDLNKGLVDYLLWADSTGNGFPDRGTANTIDDGAAAQQYGRDNVYLGVKRLAALHAASRMFEFSGEEALSRRCRREVSRAVKTFNHGFMGDHFPVCLDKSASGLCDSFTGKPLPMKTLPNWDAYSIHTSNGLLYLLMVDDLPKGLKLSKLRADLVNSWRETATRYGCGHDGKDDFKSIWTSLNLWRDCVGGYLGENLLSNCDRYWSMQQFSNSAWADKANCFAETAQNNNLVYYPRAASSFGLLNGIAGLTIRGKCGQISVDPVSVGRWPLLRLANWKTGKVPYVVVEMKKGKLSVGFENLRKKYDVAVKK